MEEGKGERKGKGREGGKGVEKGPSPPPEKKIRAPPLVVNITKAT